ncbi:Erythromycin esterase [Streptomyces sp. YIM 130001]|uniref:erythromycin esterase family protein n=1 Tax=Streptomyces sp. YIM 130001 TaxID=2259644 RepID=UPI000E657693|nr:erythromycin esterase family protein [Streptomyces sp. YIM 130001]RII16071.1 Erythromycin esterase [Streptomyces sp. YIM 130001]
MSDAPTPFADWLREHASSLTHLDPAAPLDDLEPLRELIGTARVVAVGENSHFIEEFAAMRGRVLRFLVERCGFTVLAFEYGFSEGFALDAWAQGEGTEGDLGELLAGSIPVGVGEPLRWVRQFNRGAERPVRFAGVDIPAAGGSLLPALLPVADHLRAVDPEVLPLIEEAIRIAESFAGPSASAAAPRWERLDASRQDALTALLTRLLVRCRSLAPLHVSRGDRQDHAVAVRRLEVAVHADYTFRAMSDLFAGRGLTADTSAREKSMAESLLWHLEQQGPGARVVLAAHNAHILKSPISFGGHLTGLPMGQHLHEALGDEYFALGLTSAVGHTADMRPDEEAPFGFTVADTPLEAPEPGSIEAEFRAAGIGFGLAGLRAARSLGHLAGPDRTRLQSAYLQVPVLDAFDAVLDTGTSTVAPEAL